MASRKFVDQLNLKVGNEFGAHQQCKDPMAPVGAGS